MSLIEPYNCTRCPLYKQRKHILWDKGSTDAQILLISDMPDKVANVTGKPFDGKFGTIVKEQLQKANLPLNNVHIAYLLQCYNTKQTLDNPQSKSALKVCPKHHLVPIIQQLQPDIIISFGNSSDYKTKPIVKKLLADIDYTGIYIDTIHPKRIQYGETYLKKTSQKDFTLAHQILHYDGDTPNTHNINTIEKFTTFMQELENQTKIAMDTEGTSLRFNQNTIIGVSISWDWWNGYYIPLYKRSFFGGGLESYWTSDEHQHIVSQIKEICTNKKWSKTWHNYKYDYKVLKYEYGIEIHGTAFDSIVGTQLEDDLQGKSLSDQSKRFPDLYGYDQELYNIIAKQDEVDYSKIPLEILYKYAALDAVATYRLSEVLVQELKK